MEHEPDLIVFIQTKFEEVVAGSERAQMVDVIAAIQLRVFFGNCLVPDLKLPPHADLTTRDFAPGALIASAAMIGTTVRNCLFNPTTDIAKIVRQMICVERRLYSTHT